MRPAAFLFLVVLAAAGAAWFAVVAPVEGRAADLAARIAAEDIRARSAASTDPAPTTDEARRMGESLVALRAPDSLPAPRGMAEGTPGSFAGRLPWEEVQDLLAWAAAQPRSVLEIDVRPVADDPARAACRVVLGP